MIRKFVLKCLLVLIAVLFVFPVFGVLAESDGEVLQAYITEQTMTVVTDVGLLSDQLGVLVSNQDAQVAGLGVLSDESALIRTTILVDISTSMPRAVRDGVRGVLNTMVEHKLINEEFKIVVFGEELITLHDFTADRFDLARAIERIVFDSRSSRKYEAIFETIPQLIQNESRPTFYRTIMITDGVNTADAGITREELFIRLQNERYPIDVVAVSSRDVGENRELAALARVSNGRYFSLHPNSAVAELANSLSVGEFFFFEAIVPPLLLDGTTRQVDIYDGVRSISIDVRFPVWDDPNVELPPVYEEPEVEEVEDIFTFDDLEDLLTPDIDEIQDDGVDESGTITTFIGEHLFLMLIISGAVLVVAAGLIVFFVIREKKKKVAGDKTAGAPEYGDGDQFGKTEFIGDDERAGSQYTVKISYLTDLSKSWTLTVQGELIIGRADHCQIRLSDKSVSREHCKIMSEGSGLIISHLATTNKTMLNGTTLVGNSPLQSGDTVKVGRVSLKINYIQAIGGNLMDDDLARNSSAGKTNSIF